MVAELMVAELLGSDSLPVGFRVSPFGAALVAIRRGSADGGHISHENCIVETVRLCTIAHTIAHTIAQTIAHTIAQTIALLQSVGGQQSP